MAGEIILGYDGNEGAKAALATAVRVAKAFATPLVIVFGYEPNPMGGQQGELRHAVHDIGEQMGAEATSAVHAQDPSVQVMIELVDDRPAEAILRAADEYDALAIVVGATNKGPVVGSLLGSVTYNVVHRATHPVLVVPLPADG